MISLPGNPTGLANGNTSANQFLGQIETGYKIGLGLGANTSISPFARLQIGSINQAGFTEYGGGLFNLAVAAQTTTSVRTTFGVDLAGGFDIGGTLLDLGLRLGWMHEFAGHRTAYDGSLRRRACEPVHRLRCHAAAGQCRHRLLCRDGPQRPHLLFVSYDGEVGGGTDNHSRAPASRSSGDHGAAKLRCGNFQSVAQNRSAIPAARSTFRIRVSVHVQ